MGAYLSVSRAVVMGRDFFLLRSPALKRLGPPMLHWLCSHVAHLWATSDSVPRSKAVGTPQAVGVM